MGARGTRLAGRSRRRVVAGTFALVVVIVAVAVVAALDAGSPTASFPEVTIRPDTVPLATNPDFTFPEETIPDETVPAGDTVPVTSPAATTLPGEPSDADVNECEDRVSADNVTATYADGLSMTVGKQAPVVVVLKSGGVSSSSGTVTIPGATATTTKEFSQLTCEVAAQLSGLNFEIDKPFPISQSFMGVDELDWTWQVTPKNTSANVMTVDFFPVVRTPSNQHLPGQVKTATLTIAVTAAQGPSSGHRALSWFVKALLVAVGALLVAWMVFWFGPRKDDSREGMLVRRWSERRAKRRAKRQPLAMPQGGTGQPVATTSPPDAAPPPADVDPPASDGPSGR